MSQHRALPPSKTTRPGLALIQVLVPVVVALASLGVQTGAVAQTDAAKAEKAERSASSSGFRIGFEGHGRTRLEDIGLPAFPGAVLARDKGEGRGDGDDEAAVTLGAWAGSFGLRLHVMKFASEAPPDRVAAFYAKAMAAQGTVVDCADPAMRRKPKAGEADRPSCDEGGLKAGHFEYRSGTARHFRMVHVQPEGRGSRFEVVRLQLGG